MLRRALRGLIVSICLTDSIGTFFFVVLAAPFRMNGMNLSDKQPEIREIVLGPITLRQSADGSLSATHKALATPAAIDAQQIQRWLLRQLREQVAA